MDDRGMGASALKTGGLRSIVKIQHKMKSTWEKWRGTKYDFYPLALEHLYAFRKPAKDERMSEFKNSAKWRNL